MESRRSVIVMPSEVLHIALAGLIAAALLGDYFDARTVLVVIGFALIPDLDTFTGLLLPGTHRALLHNLFVIVIAGALVFMLRGRIQERWGAPGVHAAWVGVFSLAFAGIAPDLFYNGVNPLYPLHDQFVAFTGELYLSTRDGVVNTLFETEFVGTTQSIHYSTGVDPRRGADTGAERVFPVAATGIQFLVSLLGFTVVGARLALSSR